jgi:Domain of unknown function (DUF4145)
MVVTTKSPKSEPEQLAYQCPECDGPQMFDVARAHKSRGEDGLWEEFTYAICVRCQRPVLLTRYDFGGGFAEEQYYRAYPALQRQIAFAIPEGVRRAYDEAVKTEQAKAWMATGVMAGQALEAVCKDYDPSIRTISDGMRKLLAAGVISQELFEWGNGLRVVRNRGAHVTSQPVTADDARFALDFLQALLEILYSLRRQFEVWKEQRATSEEDEEST